MTKQKDYLRQAAQHWHDMIQMDYDHYGIILNCLNELKDECDGENDPQVIRRAIQNKIDMFARERESLKVNHERIRTNIDGLGSLDDNM